MHLDFKGRHAIVTGATRGIGKEIASLLFNRGAIVIGIGKTQLRTLPAWLHNYLKVDLTNRAQVEQFCLHIQEQRHLDVLVQNAGMNVNDRIWNVAPTNLNAIMSVNLIAPFHIAKAACEVMRRQESGGHIVNIGSIWAETGKARRSVYAATKAGLAGMTRAMAADMAPHGVLVNMVSPGFTKTELTDQTLTAQEQSDLTGQIPLGRFATPLEIARLVVWLCSFKNTYITGQNLHIDGGFHNVQK